MGDNNILTIGLIGILLIIIIALIVEPVSIIYKYEYESDIIIAKENTKQDSLKLLQYKYLSKQAAVLEAYAEADKLRKQK